MTSRTYLSIGDVLSLLRQEFPDVTISKIRFLESQGLVNPERTPSGYRKFYEQDVERLRWVLRQQREHFLPLKVIKGRLEHEGPDAVPDSAAEAEAEPDAEAEAATAARAGRGDVPALVAAGHGDDASGRRGPTLPGFEGQAQARARAAGSTTAVTDASSATAERAVGRGDAVVAAQAPAREQRGANAGGTARRPAAAGKTGDAGESAGRGAKAAGRAVADPGAATPVVPLSGTSMTVDELAAASGLSVEAAAELESFGLLAGRVVGGIAYYDEDALTVARLAAGFAEFGVEARHLRLHKHAAEREAGFIEQIVLPLLRQRNPESRQRAQETTAELSRLGQALRAVLLRSALRDVLGG